MFYIIFITYLVSFPFINNQQVSLKRESANFKKLVIKIKYCTEFKTGRMTLTASDLWITNIFIIEKIKRSLQDHKIRKLIELTTLAFQLPRRSQRQVVGICSVGVNMPCVKIPNFSDSTRYGQSKHNLRDFYVIILSSYHIFWMNRWNDILPHMCALDHACITALR